ALDDLPLLHRSQPHQAGQFGACLPLLSTAPLDRAVHGEDESREGCQNDEQQDATSCLELCHPAHLRVLKWVSARERCELFTRTPTPDVGMSRERDGEGPDFGCGYP